MKTQHSKETEVYSIRGFRDTLASPVFYPVIVVALVLGVTSIFGFVQNPLKLKSMVDVMHQKVSTTNVVNGTLENRLYKVSNTEKLKQAESVDIQSSSIKSFDLFSHIDTESNFEKAPVDKDIERIAFNYDVTSENFWTDLDSSKLETATEEIERKQKEQGTIGAPLKINQDQRFSEEFKLNDDSIYALDSSNKI